MLEALFNAPVPGAQSTPIKFCHSCSVPVVGRTMHRQFCDECKRARRLEQYRLAAEVQRRKRGIRKVKGESFSCDNCNVLFIATSKSRCRFCVDCRPEMALLNARLQSKRRGENPVRREKFNEWWRDRAKSDPLVALSRLMRSLMHRELGSKNATGRRSWFNVVGYTAKELRDHLERQFLPGMTWENRGANGWHIDHIVPISAYKYDSPEHPDFRACWALANLRPLWAMDNIQKKDKRLYLI